MVLASDGLETLPDEALAEVIEAGAGDAQVIVQALLDAIAGAGRPGQDNTTVLVYRVGDGADSLHGALAGTNDLSDDADTVRENSSAGNGETHRTQRRNPRALSRGCWACSRNSAGGRNDAGLGNWETLRSSCRA